VNLVLVHGSWHDGRCWSAVAERLRRAGHTVATPTLAGNGDDLRADVTMAETVERLVEHLVHADLRDVVLVGHSFGGVVIQHVAEHVPERIRRLVFHNAYVLLDGETVFDHIPAASAAAFQALAEAAGDGTVQLPFEVFRDGFIGDADIGTARSAYAQLGPEPLARAAEPAELPAFPTLPIPRSVLHATDDNVFPAPEFSWHPKLSGRLGPFRLVQMPGSHEVMFSDPDGLADKLVEAGRD
jgi:pimeloyl-ACP methyl ester carboxylesterase